MPTQAAGPWWKCSPLTIRIVVVLATISAAWLLCFCLGPSLQACLWAVEHHSTATYQGLTVKVPWMWRQKDTPAGQREIMLVRARFGEPVESEWIVINNRTSTASKPQSPTELVQNLARLSHEAFRGTPISLDPETAKRFSCIAPHLAKMPEWQASCRSPDMRWSVMLSGPVSDMGSLRAVLQSAVIDSGSH